MLPCFISTVCSLIQKILNSYSKFAITSQIDCLYIDTVKYSNSRIKNIYRTFVLRSLFELSSSYDTVSMTTTVFCLCVQVVSIIILLKEKNMFSSQDDVRGWLCLCLKIRDVWFLVDFGNDSITIVMSLIYECPLNDGKKAMFLLNF